MNLKNKSITCFTDKFLKKQDIFQKLKDLGNRNSVPYQITKCKVALQKDLGFWMSKNPTDQSIQSRITSILDDIVFVNKLDPQTVTPQSKRKLFDIRDKYSL